MVYLKCKCGRLYKRVKWPKTIPGVNSTVGMFCYHCKCPSYDMVKLEGDIKQLIPSIILADKHHPVMNLHRDVINGVPKNLTTRNKDDLSQMLRKDIITPEQHLKALRSSVEYALVYNCKCGVKYKVITVEFLRRFKTGINVHKKACVECFEPIDNKQVYTVEDKPIVKGFVFYGYNELNEPNKQYAER